MKFGVREICDVVLKAKAAQKVGNKVFYKNEPVCYFDSLKTSSMEGAATTVYAQGGRGNARLVAWEGERTVTFTMEDALISPTGFMILSGAGLIEASDDETIKMHTTETTDKVHVFRDTQGKVERVSIELSEKPYVPGVNYTTTPETIADKRFAIANDYIYIMLMKDGEVYSEPFIPSELDIITDVDAAQTTTGVYNPKSGLVKYVVTIYPEEGENTASDEYARKNNLSVFSEDSVVLADYYVEHASGVFQVDITPDKFGGNFYLEASTLFRDTNGVDMPAEFIIPNCKVQSNFTFTMASSGDPSTFTFTMDAFPDYTRFNRTKKVLAAIQVIDTSSETREFRRLGTEHDYNSGTAENPAGPIVDYNANQRRFIEIDG